MIDYNAELHIHNEHFKRAYGIRSTDVVLDIGCGAGQSTRDAARLAPDGAAVGVDTDETAIARARHLAAAEAIPNIRFEVGDIQHHRFRPGEFDVAISRFGTMFFADPAKAFRNIAHAIRPAGRLVMLVWQTHDQNEWAVEIDRALETETNQPITVSTLDPFSLGEPTAVRRVLTETDFEAWSRAVRPAPARAVGSDAAHHR